MIEVRLDRAARVCWCALVYMGADGGEGGIRVSASACGVRVLANVRELTPALPCPYPKVTW